MDLKAINLILQRRLQEVESLRRVEHARANGLESAGRTQTSSLRSQVADRESSLAKLREERDLAVQSQRVLLDRLAAADAQVAKLGDDNRQLSIAVDALQHEVCSLRQQLQERSSELNQYVRDVRER